MNQEHPFAQYVRILGKGRRGSRALTEEEAFGAMRMVLTEQVEPIRLGAFQMSMRVHEETPEEVAGAMRAVRETLRVPTNAPAVDLDGSSYAGKIGTAAIASHMMNRAPDSEKAEALARKMWEDRNRGRLCTAA